MYVSLRHPMEFLCFNKQHKSQTLHFYYLTILITIMKNLLLASFMMLALIVSATGHTTIDNSTLTISVPQVVTLQGEWQLVTLNGMEMAGTVTFFEDKRVKFVMNETVVRDGVYTYNGSTIIITEGEKKMNMTVVELTEESLILKDEQGEIVLKR